MRNFKQFIVENTWLSRDHTDHGYGNGYVVLPKDHPLWGCSNDMDGEDFIDDHVNVHGGITLAKEVSQNNIDHMSDLDKDDLGKWVIGFDTAHTGDNLDEHGYDYVVEETQRLHDQLVKLDNKQQLPYWSDASEGNA